MGQSVSLQTERLTLRPPRAEDAGWIAREIARPEVHAMLTSVPRPYRLADAETWLAANADGTGAFVIESAVGPEGILTTENRLWGHELGYWLQKSAWGQGFMTEAAGAALDWTFAHSDAPMPSGHITGNHASRRVLAKLGFVDTEIVPRASRYYGREVAVQRMVLTAEQWGKR